jgi:hypothetical protein
MPFSRSVVEKLERKDGYPCHVLPNLKSIHKGSRTAAFHFK